MEPWYKVALPRAEVREGRSFNPNGFAIALEQVVAGRGPEDYRDPKKFIARTYFTRALREYVGMVLRRLSGQSANTAPVLTISLPPAMIQEVAKATKREHRTKSELVREALRLYFNPEPAARIARLPVYVPTKRELREIEKGRRSKDYVTIDELFRGLVGPRRGPRAKSHRARS